MPACDTTLDNRLCAWHKGPNVTQTQSAGPVRTAHMSVLPTVNIVSHNPAWSSSDNIPSTMEKSENLKPVTEKLGKMCSCLRCVMNTVQALLPVI